jgi:antitoxin (DNA-binding transcriptional repressor) of toxin-antitoxin stability system
MSQPQYRLRVDEEIIITRHGRPAGVLIGLRVAAARTALRRGKGVRLEDLGE